MFAFLSSSHLHSCCHCPAKAKISSPFSQALQLKNTLPLQARGSGTTRNAPKNEAGRPARTCTTKNDNINGTSEWRLTRTAKIHKENETSWPTKTCTTKNDIKNETSRSTRTCIAKMTPKDRLDDQNPPEPKEKSSSYSSQALQPKNTRSLLTKGSSAPPDMTLELHEMYFPLQKDIVGHEKSRKEGRTSSYSSQALQTRGSSAPPDMTLELHKMYLPLQRGPCQLVGCGESGEKWEVRSENETNMTNTNRCLSYTYNIWSLNVSVLELSE